MFRHSKKKPTHRVKMDNNNKQGFGPIRRRRHRTNAPIEPSAPAAVRGATDPLRQVLFPVSEQDRALAQTAARKWIMKIEEIYPNLRPMCAEVFLRAVDLNDMDFIHFIFFTAIPQIEPLARDLCAAMSEARYDRFVRYLTRARTQLIEGRTATMGMCTRASDARYQSVREFVWDVRRFYLLSSDVPAPPEPTPLALWNHHQAYQYPHVGDSYFFIMSLLLQSAICEEFSHHPWRKRPMYTAECPGGWAVDTKCVRMSDEESRPLVVQPARHVRTIFRDLPRAANELHHLHVHIRPAAPAAPGAISFTPIPVVLMKQHPGHDDHDQRMLNARES
jgi:hypothetical protein